MTNALQDLASAIGMTWPFFFISLLFQITITLYVIVQKIASPWVLPEKEFLEKLRLRNNRLAKVALLVGFLGTYAGIWVGLGPLAEVVDGKGSEAFIQVILALKNAFVSTLAGIVMLLWGGEVNDSLLSSLIRSIPETCFNLSTSVKMNCEQPDVDYKNRMIEIERPVKDENISNRKIVIENEQPLPVRINRDPHLAMPVLVKESVYKVPQ